MTSRGVERDHERRRPGAREEELERPGGVELDDHIQFVIDALRPHAAELGLTGRDR